MLEGYQARSFTAPTTSGHQITHDVYTRGDGPATIVILQELPGIGPETLTLADELVARNFRVVMPHLVGPLGRISLLGNTLRVFCMRKEFKMFERNQSSPVVDWVKALCRDLRDEQGCERIGVIGMCLTGNFAISLIAEDSVLAAVASQPSLPAQDQTALHMSEAEISAARDRLDEVGPMLALRFEEDKLCAGQRFKAIDAAFNDDAQRIKLIELPGPGHSVLTLDLIKGGEPAKQAMQEVVAYFQERLQA
ncbi:MAG: dienelactone hydrolase family protein [Pseudomonadota bacterium]